MSGKPPNPWSEFMLGPPVHTGVSSINDALADCTCDPPIIHVRDNGAVVVLHEHDCARLVALRSAQQS